MKRGDIVIAVTPGDYGKPRPAAVVQSDLFNATHASITLCPITSHLVDAPLFRLDLAPTQDNGLKVPSQIMVDKIITVHSQGNGGGMDVVDGLRLERDFRLSDHDIFGIGPIPSDVRAAVDLIVPF